MNDKFFTVLQIETQTITRNMYQGVVWKMTQIYGKLQQRDVSVENAEKGVSWPIITGQFVTDLVEPPEIYNEALKRHLEPSGLALLAWPFIA